MSTYSSQHASAARRREAASAARARPQARPPAPLSLSTVLAQAPSVFDGRRITAVDRNVGTIDALPERYASQVKTLYLSKNALPTMDGVQQFGALRALSAADNQLADLEALRPLAGLQLEAASFEGNPVADLPNYRAHVLDLLGPSLQLLDGRPVSAEERGAAGGAVAHEATMLALMLSNACLVHKLGRAVQLVRLHCKLKCAVLGGQCGSGAGGGHDAAGCGPDTSRLLQLWDYEASLNRQERQAILLAIRREVGRRYKRMQLAGAKLDGSAKAWQQAFAQVMLAQQETVASLMKLLEDARAEASAVLRPLLRPASPMKLRMLRSEQEADSRVRHDREDLITELRDAFLGLAEGAGEASPRRNAAQYEQRIRALHAALEASSVVEAPPPVAAPQKQQGEKEEGEEGSGAHGAGGWSISAARGGSAAASPSTSPSKAAAGRPKSALKQPAAGRSPSRVPRTANRDGGSEAPRAAQASPRLASAHRAARPSFIPGPPAMRQSPSRAASLAGPEQLAVPLHKAEAQPEPWEWQADDHLEVPAPEQHRTTTPAPFCHQDSGDCSRGSLAAGRERHGAAAATARPHTAPPVRSSRGVLSLPASSNDSPAALPLPVPAVAPQYRSRPSSPLGRPASAAASPCPGSPAAWNCNPLAAPPRRPSSPAMQSLLGSLSYESERKQIDTLQAALAEAEAARARLVEANEQLGQANTELADSLQQLHGHAQGLEEQLGQLREEAACRERELEAEAESARQSRQELEAEVVLLRMERDSQGAQLAALRAEVTAREEALAALRHKVEELEGRDPIRLALTVSFEAELMAERVRASALAGRSDELAAELARRQWQERLLSASDELGGRACLRRVFQRWREAAAEQASLGRLASAAAAALRSWLLRKWLGRWRQAVARSHLLAAREQQRAAALLQRAWTGWRQHWHDIQLARALDVAATLHRQQAASRHILHAWRAYAVALRQVELPPNHPTMAHAAELQRVRLQRTALLAWHGWLTNHVKPKLAKAAASSLASMMGAQRRAWLAWRDYMAHRRHRAMLKEVAAQHLLWKFVQRWQAGAALEKAERAAALRGAITHKVLLLRRAWRAWWELMRAQHAAQAAAAIASVHRKRVVLRSAWQCWQEWVGLASDLQDRRRVNTLRAAFCKWRLATQAAERGRCALRFHERQMGLRWRQAFRAWRLAVEGKKLRRQRLAHAQEVLLRWHLGRHLATWRRGVLISKLQRALGSVQQLQAAIESVREELQRKAAEVESLESVRVTVEGRAESLSLRVTSLDSELAVAEQRAAELQAALDAARADCDTARATRDAAVAAAAAAAAESEVARRERDEATASRAEALAAVGRAQEESEAARQQAADAAAAQAAAEQGHVAAEAAAAEAVAQRDALAAQREAAAADLQRLQGECEGLTNDLERTLTELQRLTDALGALQQEHAQLKVQHEVAVSERVLTSAERQAALKQAERLATMLEAEERQRQQLQATANDLQAQATAYQTLDEELRHMAERSDQLHAENQAQAAALQRGEAERARLQAMVEALRAEEGKLAAALGEQQRQRQELASLVETLQAAKLSLEGQLQRAEAAAQQLGGDKQALGQVVARLQAEREGLVQVVDRAAGEEEALEQQVAQLQGQLRQANVVLQSCREMLVGCGLTGAPSQDADAPLIDLMGCVQAALLEKEAALRALAQDNRERAQRMEALQALVDSLSRQVLSPASRSSGRVLQAHQGPMPAHPLAASPTSSVSATASQGSWERRAAAPQPGPQPGSPGSVSSNGRLAVLASPAASQFSFSPTTSAGPVAGPPQWQGRAAEQADRVAARPLPAVAVSSPAGAAEDPASAPPYFASTFATPSPRAPAASFQPLGPAVHLSRPGVAAEPSNLSSPLAASTAALNSLLGQGAGRPVATPAAPPAPLGSSCSSARGATGDRLTCIIQQLPAGRDVRAAGAHAVAAAGGSPPASPERLRQLLLQPAAAGTLPAEVSEERLGFLLELVVQKRVTASEAQQVIKAAGDGDARPLLRVLESVKRRIQGPAIEAARQGQQAVQHQRNGGTGQPGLQPVAVQPALSPGSASELAAIRRQIQQLQGSIRP